MNKTKPPISQCKHFFDPINLVEGFNVYPSSLANERTRGELKPDFGLYADFAWEPAWRNEYIVWPDYEIPDFPNVAVEQIQSAAARIFNGEIVEIGCIGGHGRTGTIAACLAVTLSDMASGSENRLDATAAIKRVREQYCVSALESREQEWWVELYTHKAYGSPQMLRAKPVPPHSPLTFSAHICEQVDHYEMLEAGSDDCLVKTGCDFWEDDSFAWSNEVPSDEPLEPENITRWKLLLQHVKESV